MMSGDLCGESTMATMQCGKVIVAVRCRRNEYEYDARMSTRRAAQMWRATTVVYCYSRARSGATVVTTTVNRSSTATVSVTIRSGMDTTEAMQRGRENTHGDRTVEKLGSGNGVSEALYKRSVDRCLGGKDVARDWGGKILGRRCSLEGRRRRRRSC